MSHCNTIGIEGENSEFKSNILFARFHNFLNAENWEVSSLKKMSYVLKKLSYMVLLSVSHRNATDSIGILSLSIPQFNCSFYSID